jgi:hypothetical protein
LLTEDVPAERAAALLELDITDNRRLTRAAGRPAMAYCGEDGGQGSS